MCGSTVGGSHIYRLFIIIHYVQFGELCNISNVVAVHRQPEVLERCEGADSEEELGGAKPWDFALDRSFGAADSALVAVGTVKVPNDNILYILYII